jgi:hypothetical protein
MISCMSQDDLSSGSVLMSEGLDADLDIDSETSNVFKDRAKILIVKTREHGEPNVIVAALRAMGAKAGTFTLEMIVQQMSGVETVLAFRDKNITFHGIEMHHKDKVITLLDERDEPYYVESCNAYDIVVENEECSLVIVFAQPPI